jgi:predicted TIM-barrel fold metal-dependent hydrolase
MLFFSADARRFIFVPKQILKGSDFPAKRDLAASIKAIEDLDISQKNKESILRRNLEHIFGDTLSVTN